LQAAGDELGIGDFRVADFIGPHRARAALRKDFVERIAPHVQIGVGPAFQVGLRLEDIQSVEQGFSMSWLFVL